MQRIIGKAVFTAASLAYPTVGLAYAGPGLGVGALAVILDLLGSILLALFAIFWCPFKRILKRRRQKRTREAEDTKQGDKSQAPEG